MCSLDKHTQSDVKVISLSNVPAHGSVMSPWPKSQAQALQSALEHSLKFFCRRVSNFTLYGTLLGERAAIPKPQVYLLPRAIWMFRDLSNWTYLRTEICLLFHPTKALTTVKGWVQPKIKTQSLSSLMQMESGVKFCTPHNISGAPKQNNTAAFS